MFCILSAQLTVFALHCCEAFLFSLYHSRPRHSNFGNYKTTLNLKAINSAIFPKTVFEDCVNELFFCFVFVSFCYVIFCTSIVTQTFLNSHFVTVGTCCNLNKTHLFHVLKSQFFLRSHL